MGHKLCVLCKFCSLSLWLFPSSRRQWIWRQKAHQRLVAVGSLPSNPGLSWHPLSVAAVAKTDSCNGQAQTRFCLFVQTSRLGKIYHRLPASYWLVWRQPTNERRRKCEEWTPGWLFPLDDEGDGNVTKVWQDVGIRGLVARWWDNIR